MKELVVFVFGLFIACSLIVGEASAESETVKGVKKDFTAFRQEMDEKLDAAEKKLKELKEKSGQNSDAMIAELESSTAKLKKEVSELKDDGQDGWRSFKKSLSASLDRLNTKIQKALRE